MSAAQEDPELLPRGASVGTGPLRRERCDELMDAIPEEFASPVLRAQRDA